VGHTAGTDPREQPKQPKGSVSLSAKSEDSGTPSAVLSVLHDPSLVHFTLKKYDRGMPVIREFDAACLDDLNHGVPSPAWRAAPIVQRIAQSPPRRLRAVGAFHR